MSGGPGAAPVPAPPWSEPLPVPAGRACCRASRGKWGGVPAPASRDACCQCAGLLGPGQVVMEHCTLGQGISFTGGPPTSLGSLHQPCPMEVPWNMRLVPRLCAWWLFSARGSTWLLPARGGCSRVAPSHGTGLETAQGGHRQVTAGSPELLPCSHPRQQHRSPCWRDTGASPCHRFACPGLGRALTSPWPCTRGSPWLPGAGAFSPARHSPVLCAPLPCHGCPGAGRTWPRGAQEQISNGRNWGQPRLWWRATHPRGWRHLGSLSPWPPAPPAQGPAWERPSEPRACPCHGWWWG